MDSHKMNSSSIGKDILQTMVYSFTSEILKPQDVINKANAGKVFSKVKSFLKFVEKDYSEMNNIIDSMELKLKNKRYYILLNDKEKTELLVGRKDESQ